MLLLLIVFGNREFVQVGVNVCKHASAVALQLPSSLQATFAELKLAQALVSCCLAVVSSRQSDCFATHLAVYAHLTGA